MTSHSTVVEALHLARKVRERGGQRRLLVEARDLDDELHARDSEYAARWRLVTARGQAQVVPYTRALSMPDERAARPNTGPPVPFARIRAWNWPAILLGALILATIAGTLVYPTYSNYDSTYSLIWGRELLNGDLPSFDAYRAPTQHPLAVVFGAVMALFGYWGDRLLVFATLASFVVLVAGPLPARPHDLHDARRPHRRGDHLHPLRLPVPRGARLRRHPVPRADRVGRRAGGRHARGAAAPSWACCCSPACCAPRRGC